MQYIKKSFQFFIKTDLVYLTGQWAVCVADGNSHTPVCELYYAVFHTGSMSGPVQLPVWRRRPECILSPSPSQLMHHWMVWRVSDFRIVGIFWHCLEVSQWLIRCKAGWEEAWIRAFLEPVDCSVVVSLSIKNTFRVHPPCLLEGVRENCYAPQTVVWGPLLGCVLHSVVLKKMSLLTIYQADMSNWMIRSQA